ncbi:MAG: polyribonucleotide nucleotidyltransferase [Planctomycetes bacterium]|nr:polyribonucleotide nucleotidyltransferase [Planctomycetota bacterium]
MNHVVVEREIGGRTLRIETGKWAKQAAGAAVVSLGETMVLAAVAEQPLREGMDFFPMTVDYRERGYAAGMIFGGRFMKRESRPSEKEILTMRLIDRHIRPLWPNGYASDVLIQCLVLSAEQDVDPDVVAMIATSASLAVSELPFQGPTGGVRIGCVDGQFVVNPGVEALKKSTIELVVAGTAKAVTMVEAGAQCVTEDQMFAAIQHGHEVIKTIVGAIDELASKGGAKKMEFAETPADPLVNDLWGKHEAEFMKTGYTETKFGRAKARKALTEKMVATYAAKDEAEEKAGKPSKGRVKELCSALWERTIRKMITLDKRCDGRSRKGIRPIWCEVQLLPRAHGSALFTRGETQALVAMTLGTVDDQQLVESLTGEFNERFLLHYNFPSFCVGEVKMPRGPGRREIGHGRLAKRGLEAMLPDYEKFPYTIRLVSEILESNGSSSMATVCGGTLALYDAGVPMKAPVAGIAMGLVEEGGKHYVISDILGDEDHYGDMDFKVAGTKDGITALQMDIKSSGVPSDVMRQALDQAREGRIHILDQMAQTMAAPREQISEHAPKIVQLKIDQEKIGKLIGPGGKTIRGLEEKYGVTINVEDTGNVVVAAPKRDKADEVAALIEAICGTPEVGRVYHGEVVNIKDFGVFVEIMPGVDGMCHVSELDVAYVKSPGDVVKVGDKIDVKLISIDDLGRMKLSRKALLIEQGVPVPPRPEGAEDRGGGGGGGRDRRPPRRREGSPE